MLGAKTFYITQTVPILIMGLFRGKSLKKTAWRWPFDEAKTIGGVQSQQFVAKDYTHGESLETATWESPGAAACTQSLDSACAWLQLC